MSSSFPITDRLAALDAATLAVTDRQARWNVDAVRKVRPTVGECVAPLPAERYVVPMAHRESYGDWLVEMLSTDTATAVAAYRRNYR